MPRITCMTDLGGWPLSSTDAPVAGGLEPSVPTPRQSASTADTGAPGIPPAEARPEEARLFAAICPYLLAPDGWRAARPVREHRCTAVVPPPPLPGELQRSLCLTARHPTCDRYLAAARVRDERPGIGEAARLNPLPAWAEIRTAPLILDGRPPGEGRRGIPDPRPVRFTAARRSGVVAALVVAAALITVLALAGGNRPSASDSPPGVGVGGEASGSPPASSIASAASSLSPTSGASVPSGPAVAAGTYRVRRGDSLRRIAERLGTTVAILRALNDLGDPPRIRVGQLLNVP